MICDFSTVIKILVEHKREGMPDFDVKTNEYTQLSLISGLFDSFYCAYDGTNEKYNKKIFEFDEGVVSKWINGKRPVFSEIVSYYRTEENRKYLAFDFSDYVFPYLFDFDGVVKKIYDIVRNDRENLSQQMREKLTEGYPFSSDEEKCGFVSNVILTALDGIGVIGKANSNAVTVTNIIYGADVPKPCKYFCGRDTEIEELHTVLDNHSKLFLSGVAGMGKSECTKAYAQKYKKEYRNIFYFIYEGSLNKLVTSINHSDDNISDNETVLFKRHIAFLKSLNDDTLLIIDNFNVTSAGDSFLPEFMKLRCKILFTTRRSFDNGYTYILKEISDTEILFNLVSKYYCYAEENRQIIFDLIEAVHHHTLSVEMVAKLLHSGKHSPETILEHLRENSADPESADKIKINKDGIISKDIYYNHIRALFSLYLLDENYQSIMRCIAFVPSKGIRISRLASLMNLSDTNGITELLELGFISSATLDMICLHPMIKDITVLDLKPSMSNCSDFMKSLDRSFLVQGIELPNYESIISTMENVIKYAVKDDTDCYILMLENFYGFVASYNKYDNMLTSINEMKTLLDNPEIGDNNDRAQLYNNRAMYARETGENPAKAISNQHKALSLCEADKNLVLFANINMNLGLLYYENGKQGRGLDFMEKAFTYIKLSQAYNNDLFVIACNYAVSLCGVKMFDNAIQVLDECALITENLMPRYHAGFVYETANVYVYKRQFTRALKMYNRAFDEYSANGLINESVQAKVRAASLLKQYGVDYPKEWEIAYIAQ